MNPLSLPVPPGYRGVWVRRLLQAPGVHDESTIVHWLQCSRWHADLRIPAPPPAGDRRLHHQGFSGWTTVERLAGGVADHEVCTWHREFDLQPPRAEADAGAMVFETPDRVIETGVHGGYLEVWERLPASTWRHAVLELSQGDAPPQRLLVAGDYAMHVRPRRSAWPAGTATGEELRHVVERNLAQAEALLDFEISFGRITDAGWTILHSSFPNLEGTSLELKIEPSGPDLATVHGMGWPELIWHLREWSA